MTPIKTLESQFDWLATTLSDLRACRREDHAERTRLHGQLIRARSALLDTIHNGSVRKTRRALELLAMAGRIVERADEADVALDLQGSRPHAG